MDYAASVRSLEDDVFDLVYPAEVRELSAIHWSPVQVARHAAAFLASRPGARVLDVGCGPGKFCIVGAVTTEGVFTGIEQRVHLRDLARSVCRRARITNATFQCANVMSVDFSAFDAFYLFNPFEENLDAAFRIDPLVELSGALYENYTEHVAAQLSRAPMGTRVATYCGEGEFVPNGYACVEVAFESNLRLWEKTGARETGLISPVVRSNAPADA